MAYQRRPYQALALVGADLPGQLLIRELDLLFAKDSQKLIDTEVEQSELGVCVTRQVQHHQAVAVADHALDAEVVYGGHLRRDVVVLEVLGHLGEAAASSKAEERASGRREGRERGGGRSGGSRSAVVYVDDALSAHAEREAAVFVEYAVAGQRTLEKSGRL